MTEAIIVALISAFVSIIGSASAVMATQKAKKDEMMKEQQKANDDLKKDVKDNIRMIEKSISNLETKYEKETAIISLKISDLQKGQEKTKDHEARIAVLEDSLKSAHHRISGIEDRLK